MRSPLPFLEGGNLSEALYFCEEETFVAQSFLESLLSHMLAGKGTRAEGKQSEPRAAAGLGGEDKHVPKLFMPWMWGRAR